MPTTVPMLPAQSIACWELEATWKTAPAGSAWRPFGELPEWTDLGPRVHLVADKFAGVGREAHRITGEGKSYGPVVVGPFAVVDPRILSVFWGQEVSAPSQIGATAYYRHTATPTTRGRLTSIAVQMLDKQGSAEASPVTDKNTWLGVVMPTISIRGERVAEDGSGGRVMAAVGLLGHKDDTSVADKTVSLDDKAPFRWSHGKLTFWGEQLFRVLDWEFTGDNEAQTVYTHQDSDGDNPYEPVHDGVSYRPFRMTVMADGEKFSTDGGTDELLKELVRQKRKGNATIKATRTLDQDEWQLNLTDLHLESALKKRSRGPGKVVEYEVVGVVRASTFQWVDTSTTRFLPS